MAHRSRILAVILKPFLEHLRRTGAAAAACALLCTTTAAAAPASHPEQQLISALAWLHQGHLEQAWQELDTLVQREPNFGLARLFHHELDAARNGGVKAPAPPMADDELRALEEEARLRLQRPARPTDALPDAVLQIAPGQTHAILVDQSQARLYLLEQRDGELTIRYDYYASIGKAGIGKQRRGDNRTPVGVYRITDFIPSSRLADLYGAGAFPLDYPNVWDRRLNRTGDGIWVHGVPRATYVRAPRSSEGCVTLANADLLSLKPHIQFGQTTVVLSDAVEWLPRADWQARRDTLRTEVERWRERWSAVDTESYLAYYAEDFTAGSMSRSAFVAHKRRVNAGKAFIDVSLSDLELYRYPGEAPLWLARFTQRYRSDNYSRQTEKDQFWRQTPDGRWQIVAENNR
jgi:murein L,D-transpeptidase YafK